MPTPTLFIYIAFCGFLIIIGSYLVVFSHPYMTNSTHTRITAIKNIFFDKLPAWFFFEIKTNDAFTANNPVDIEITTTLINLDAISRIQVSFVGAEQSFSEDEPIHPEVPPSGSSKEAYEQYEKAFQEYLKELEDYSKKEFEASTSHITWLSSDQDYDEFKERQKEIEDILKSTRGEEFEYTPRKFYSTLSGSIKNLIYSSGGKFDVELTINIRDGATGYEIMSGTSYILQDVIEVSPPEALLQIKNNNIMTGLGYIGIGLPFLVAGLVGILDIFKHFAFGG